MSMGNMVRIQSFRRICSGAQLRLLNRPMISCNVRRRLFCSSSSPQNLPPNLKPADLKPSQTNRVSMLQNELEKLQHEIDGTRNDIAKVVVKFEMGLAEERRHYLRTVAEDNVRKCVTDKFSHFMGFLIPFGLGGGLAYYVQSRKKNCK